MTLADFASLPWAEALAGCPHEEIGRFCELFTAEAERRKEAGDERGERAYRFLVAIGALRAAFDRPSPNWEARFKGLLGPDDLDEEDLILLESLLPQVRKMTTGHGYAMCCGASGGRRIPLTPERGSSLP
ncbi:MAG: hypothetical protein R3F03_08840 [Opitutaceae bacterium]